MPFIKPIPETAKFDDIMYVGAFMELAIAMVTASARRQIVMRYTGIKSQVATSLYRKIHQSDAVSGPVKQYRPKYFAPGIRSPRFSGLAWNLQGATFLECYDTIARSVEVKPHRGWLLLTAYYAYLKVTDKLARAENAKRLDINQAYSLLAFSGINNVPEMAEVVRISCKKCGAVYLVDTAYESHTQKCPVHAMSDHLLRLTHQAQSAKMMMNCTSQDTERLELHRA